MGCFLQILVASDRNVRAPGLLQQALVKVMRIDTVAGKKSMCSIYSYSLEQTNTLVQPSVWLLACRSDLGHLRSDGHVNEESDLVLDLEKLSGLYRRESVLDFGMVFLQQI